MNASPINHSSALSYLKWSWWWSLAHLAEAAVAIRRRLTGDPVPATDLAAAGPGHSAWLSAKWPVLAFAGLAAYGIGILLGLVLRSQII